MGAVELRAGSPRRRMATMAAVAAALMVAVATPAVAQRGGKPPATKLSKPVQSLLAQAQPLLTEAQTLQQAGNKEGAAAKAREAVPFLDQAEALPNRTPDDVFITSQLRLNAGIISSDNAMILKALEDGLASGKLSAEDQAKYLRNIGSLSLQANNMTRAMQAFEQLQAANPNDPQLLIEIAELHRRSQQPQKAVTALQQAIAVQEKTGTKADEAWYRRALAIAYDAKLPAEIVSTSEALLRAHPNPTNWRDVLVIYRESGRFDDQANLDILRLMRANNALAGERDFAEYADTAATRGLPGEAKAVIDEGIQKGALTAAKPFVKELTASVNPKVAADRASLPGLAKEARAAANGRAAMGTADAFLGYGQWREAADLYRVALQKGGIDAATANTRLALALGKAGDRAGAEAALKAVTGAPRDQLARYMMIWLAGQAPQAPQA